MPPQATVAWAVDTELHGRNCAAGNLTLTPGAGVTLNAPYLGTLVVPPGGAYTLKRGAEVMSRDVVELVNSEHDHTAPMGPVCCAVGTLPD